MIKKLLKSTKGFTLLELLVTVLIIGILATIGSTQYRRVVTKSKAAKLQTLLAAATQAVERYYLVQGSYPKSFDDLDVNIDLPTTNGLDARSNVACGSSLVSSSYKRGNDFEISLYYGGIDQRYLLSAHFIDGKYKCRGFVHYFAGSGQHNGSTYCGEHYYNRACESAGCDTGIFCKN